MYLASPPMVSHSQEKYCCNVTPTSTDLRNGIETLL